MSKELMNPISYADLGATYSDAHMENGTKVVVIKRESSPIYMRASFLAGSKFDRPSKQGVAHFLEHMLAAGSTKFPSKDKLAAHIERYGGTLGASTGMDLMNVNVAVGDPNDISIAAEVLHEMILEPLFNPAVIETERKSILNELSEKESNPNQMVWEIYRKLFFQKTRMGQSGLGDKQSIQDIRKEDLETFYNDKITSGRMVLIVCGDTTLEQVKNLADNYLSVPDGIVPKSGRELPVVREDDLLIEHYNEIEQVHLIFGFRTVPNSHPDNSVLHVVAEALGGGRAASLTKILRYERGLVYAVNAWSVGYSQAGVWVINTSTQKDNLQEVVTVITDEVKRILDSGLTDEEVNFARQKIIKSSMMKLQSSKDWVDWHTLQDPNEMKSSSLWDYTKRIGEVTPEMTRRIAQKYFGNDKWYLGLLGDVPKNGKDVVVKI